jgi:hypothetical protein
MLLLSWSNLEKNQFAITNLANNKVLCVINYIWGAKQFKLKLNGKEVELTCDGTKSGTFEVVEKYLNVVVTSDEG